MKTRINDALAKIKTLNQLSLEMLLIDTYKLLDSKDNSDYNLSLSSICHVANINSDDAMVQQLLHDCVVKSRIFLYDGLLFKINPQYQPNISVQDSFLQSLYTSKTTNTTLTKPQKEIFDFFQKKKRVVVSAPTSFGKTRIIREIILHNNYRNIGLIMPTVSLLSEQYQEIKKYILGYVISKSSRVKIDNENKYILILTPERMNSFLEDNPDFQFDFFVMDEIYKVDYKLNDDRFRIFSDILYRLAKSGSDFYLIGPYISGFSSNFRERFDVSIKIYDIEIVQKDYYILDNILNRGCHLIESGSVQIVKDKFENLFRLVSEESINGKFLVYRYQKKYVEETAKKLTGRLPIKSYNDELVAYLSENVSSDWDLVSCIKKGVAFHHGAMPRHIQDLIVDEFNETEKSSIDFLFCTTSLTEGINSAAKNVVLYDKKIGNGELLKTLDRKNIEGRAGRFMQHFIGRVFYLEFEDGNDLETIVELESFDAPLPSVETLIQLEIEDIQQYSKSRYEEHNSYLDNLLIPHEIIRGNKFVSVEGQIKLINVLRCSGALDKYLFLGTLPNSDCLSEMLSIIYDCLFTDNDVGRNYDGDVGKSILIGLTKYYIYYSPSFKLLLQNDTIQKARSTDNSRIRYVFNLMAKYFEFVWPKYLKAFEGLYNFVATEQGCSKINLAILIAKLEYGTSENHEIILRDSGLPTEIVKKISKYFVKCNSFEDVQKTNIFFADKIKMVLPPIELKILNRYI
ncbi:MAG: DEAD/DEAH box helicase [Bacteroidetes bacterium]|nr:DEAD/DEAH box helicase [Bacteroidota bacterium]